MRVDESGRKWMKWIKGMKVDETGLKLMKVDEIG